MLRDYDLGEVDESLIGKKVRLVGWADTIRELRKILILRKLKN